MNTLISYYEMLQENHSLDKKLAKIAGKAIYDSVMQPSRYDSNVMKECEDLLKMGADPNFIDSNANRVLSSSDKYQTLTQRAISHNHLELLQLFIKYGGDIHALDLQDANAMYIALVAFRDSIKMLEFLINNGVDVNGGSVLMNPLKKAISIDKSTSSNYGVFLLMNGADPFKAAFTSEEQFMDYIQEKSIHDVDALNISDDLKRRIKTARRSKKMFGI